MKKELRTNTKDNKLVKGIILGTITLVVVTSGFVYATNITKDNKNESTDVTKYYTEMKLEDEKTYDYIEEDCNCGEEADEVCFEKEEFEEGQDYSCNHEDDCKCGPEFYEFEIEDVPGVTKDCIEYFLNTAFGVGYQKGEYTGSVQPKTVLSLLDKALEELEEDQKKNNVDVQEQLLRLSIYSNLFDADIYGIGDRNGSTYIESNYDQYDFSRQLEGEGIVLEKYTKPIRIKLGIENDTIASDCICENTNASLDEILEYQANALKNNKYYVDGEVEYEDMEFRSMGMIVMNGNNTTDEDYLNYARAKKIKVTINNKEYFFDLEDTSDVQLLDLDFVTKDISKALDITVEVLEKYEGRVSQDVYIADVQFDIESDIPTGR